MGLVVLGINHTSATIELRERVAFAPDQMESALQEAVAMVDSREIVILSTCNRTELFFPCHREGATAAEVLSWLARYHRVQEEDLADCHYVYHDNQAVRHAMQVAAGLDSMVLGEPQILGQMKSAVAVAAEAGTVKNHMRRLFDHVFAVAKQVRTDTAIGRNPVSVAFAAVDLSRHIFSDLRDTSALLIGAGETIELVARHLRDAGVRRIVIANRTLGRARDLAQRFNAEAVLLSDIPEQLVDADIVISSTASQLPILGKGAVERALKKRRHRPIFMVDIAVPRDIEVQVGELDDIYLYSVDDLKGIIDANKQMRIEEASKADDIIEAGVGRFRQWLRSQDSVATIRAFREQSEAIKAQELERAVRALAKGEAPEQVLEGLAHSLTNKLLHGPTSQLKRAGEEGRADVLQTAEELFQLANHKTDNDKP